MMKFASTLFLLVVLLIGTTACTSDVPKNADDLPEIFPSPDYYTSIEDYENQNKQTQARTSVNNDNVYFIPTKVPKGFAFSNIKEREDVYIAVTYTTQGNAATTAPSSYATERLNSLICQYTISTDPQVTIDQLTQYVGYDQAVTYNDKTYSMLLAVDPSAPETIVGYDLAFVEDGHVILLHLPAIDTLDNMMEYAEVTMVTLD